MLVPLDESRTNLHPVTALKIFMFFFVGGLVGLGHYLIGGSPLLVPLVIVLAGLGAVACIEVFVRPSE
jgi:fatty acid desaturase